MFASTESLIPVSGGRANWSGMCYDVNGILDGNGAQNLSPATPDQGFGSGSGRILCFCLDPHLIFKLLWMKECRNGFKSHLLEENLKIMTNTKDIKKR